jgi:hypothetical protein
MPSRTARTRRPRRRQRAGRVTALEVLGPRPAFQDPRPGLQDVLEPVDRVERRLPHPPQPEISGLQRDRIVGPRRVGVRSRMVVLVDPPVAVGDIGRQDQPQGRLVGAKIGGGVTADPGVEPVAVVCAGVGMATRSAVARRSGQKIRREMVPMK